MSSAPTDKDLQDIREAMTKRHILANMGFAEARRRKAQQEIIDSEPNQRDTRKAIMRLVHFAEVAILVWAIYGAFAFGRMAWRYVCLNMGM